jgi:hypothetical protein
MFTILIALFVLFMVVSGQLFNPGCLWILSVVLLFASGMFVLGFTVFVFGLVLG